MLTKTMPQLQKIDLSTAGMFKWIGVPGMIADALYSIAQAPWFTPFPHKHAMLMHDTGLMFALLGVMFLALSRNKPLLRMMSKLVQGVAPDMIGKAYVGCGCVGFALYVIL